MQIGWQRFDELGLPPGDADRLVHAAKGVFDDELAARFAEQEADARLVIGMP